jgi:alanine racemase
VSFAGEPVQRPVTRWAWAEIDLDAIRHNVALLRAAADPSAVWAVVKADGYGHGAVAVARAALAAGAEGLCVAYVAEGIELRRAGIDAPILLLGQQPPETAPHVVAHRLTPTVTTREYLDALVAERPDGLPVHLKVDTGMQRIGVHPHAAASMVEAIVSRSPHLRLAGVFTHLAVADSTRPDHLAFTGEQLDAFDKVVAQVRERAGDGVAVHAANSAGVIAHPRSRYDLVRTGIAMYGISPGPDLDALCAGLRPAMELRARVSYVKQVRAGSAISYGLRHRFDRDTTVATVPIGYADGVPRRLWAVGGQVLLGGRRRPIVGVVTMDQLMVDCGDDEAGADVAIGDDVVLLGTDGDEIVRAEEWADRLDTIGYEIVCGVSGRVPRVPRRSIDA